MARHFAGFKYIKTLDGSPPPIRWVTMTGGSFYEGAVLRASYTTAKGMLAAANGTAILGVLGCNCTASETDRSKPVYLATDKSVFEAIGLAARTAACVVNGKYTLNVRTTSNFRLAVTLGSIGKGNATACCRVVGYNPDDSGAIGTRYWVTFINKNSLFGDASNSK